MTLGGQRLFGAHKTWRGFVVGIIAATVALWIQQLLIGALPWLAQLTTQINYAHLPTLILGALFAIGALAGDAIESFFKRRRGIPPGHSWFPFDQIDYIVGGAIATLPFVMLSIWQYVWLVVLWLGVHLLSTYVGWKLGLKDKPI